MDPQTIERAIKRYIDISVRLGALEDEVPPRPAASSSSAWTKLTKCSDGSKAASEHAGGWPGGRFGLSQESLARHDGISATTLAPITVVLPRTRRCWGPPHASNINARHLALAFQSPTPHPY